MMTEKQQKWIILHFKNTKNDDILRRFGISHSALHRFAREHALKKTKQFQSKCQLAAAKAARAANKLKGFPPKGYHIPKSEQYRFKPGETPEKRLGKKRNQIRIQKSAESRRKTLASEKRRVLFGLEQRTKLKVVAAPPAKAAYRHTLKKRGYIVSRAAKIIFYDANTLRSDRVEQTAVERYRFIFTELKQDI